MNIGIKYNKQDFFESIKEGDSMAVELFLKDGINPNIKNEFGDTAIIGAVTLGYTNIVEILINNPDK